MSGRPQNGLPYLPRLELGIFSELMARRDWPAGSWPCLRSSPAILDAGVNLAGNGVNYKAHPAYVRQPGLPFPEPRIARVATDSEPPRGDPRLVLGERVVQGSADWCSSLNSRRAIHRVQHSCWLLAFHLCRPGYAIAMLPICLSPSLVSYLLLK
jgi:hypothetical protein